MPVEFTPADDAVANVIRTRRTINDFREELPPRELVLQAIELARWAPNHKLTEPWRFHLLGPESIRKIVEINTELVRRKKGDAAAEMKQQRWSSIPGWIVVTSQVSSDSVRDQENYASVCCGIQNLMLFLWSKNIGTKWATGGVLQQPELVQLLEIEPEAERIVGLIWYGFPAKTPESRRMPVSQITIEHP